MLCPFFYWDEAHFKEKVNIGWQFIAVDPDEMAQQRLYWQQFHDAEHAQLTTAFHAYRHTNGQGWFDADRHPGKSQKWIDRHRTTFKP